MDERMGKRKHQSPQEAREASKDNLHSGKEEGKEMIPRYLIYTILVLSSASIGYYAGYKVTKPSQVQETYKPSIVQSDGSVVLERKPDAKAKPKQIIPPGSKVERIVSVEVETEKPTTHVTVDLTVVSEPDGGKRVVASSPDGRIIGSTDIPVAPILIPRVQSWTVGGLYSPSTRRYGGFVQYKKGPYVAQVLAMSDNVYVGVGITF